MSETPVPPPIPSSLTRFDVVPYRPDGGFTTFGSGLLLVTAMAVGAVLGTAAAWVSQWIYLVLIFPLIIGLIVGGVAHWAVQTGKTRNPWLGGVAGFFGGCVAMLAMHFFDYQQFKATLPDPNDLQPMQRAIMEMKDDAFESLLKIVPPDQHRELIGARRALRVRNLFDFIDFQAWNGVEIGEVGPGNKGNGRNLGYVGSYIYFGIETLIVAGIAFAMTRKAAAQPFCVNCMNWKKRHTLGSIQQTGGEVKGALASGDVAALAVCGPTPARDGAVQLVAKYCPLCAAQSPVEMDLIHVSTGQKGEIVEKSQGIFTYPGEAFPVLQAIFQAPLETPATAATPSAESDVH